MACDDRQLTEAQRQAGYQNQRTGVQRAIRPFSGRPTIDNLIDYINRELQPAVRQTRDAVNDVYLQVADNAPSGNPLAYYFSTATAAADPTTGRIRLNASPQDTATVIRISQTNARLADVAPWLDVMAGSSTTPLGVVTLSDAINPGRSLRFDLNTMVDQGTYWDLGVSIIESTHDDPFVEDEAVVLAFIPGVASTGTTVPPGALTPIGPNTVLGNPTASTAAPTEIPVNDLGVLGRKGIAGTGNLESIDVPDASVVTGETMFLKGTSTRTALRFTNFTLADLPLLTNNRFIGNVSGATSRPIYTDLAQLAQDLFGIGWDATTHNFRLTDVLDNTFMGNISGATTHPQPTPLSDLDSVSVTYENVTKSFVREALTGDVTALQNNNTVTINADAISNTKLRDSGPLSVIGRAANTTGDPADISAVAASGAVLRESGSTLGFGTIATAGITDAAVTNAKLANMAAGTQKGRQIDAGTGAPVDLTGAEQGENLRLGLTESLAPAPGTINDQAVDLRTKVLRSNPSADGDVVYTGFLVGSSNTDAFFWLVKLGGDGRLVLRNEDAGSTAANRITTPAAADYVLDQANSACLLTYVAGRWLVMDEQPYSISAINLTPTGSQGTIDISSLRHAGVVTLQPTGTFDIDGFTAKPAGFWFDLVYRDTTTHVGTLNEDAAAATAANRIRNPGNTALAFTTQEAVRLRYSNTRWRVTARSARGFSLTDGDKGDITVATSGTAWTIDNNVVTDAKLRDSGALSVIGRSANSSGDPADISGTASSDQVLRVSGTTLGFGTVATAGIADNAVTNAKLRDSAALSLIGRNVNSSGDPGDIATTSGSNGVLVESGGTLSFGLVTTLNILDNTIANADLRQSAALSVVGRTNNTIGNVADISATAGTDFVLRESASGLSFGQVATAGIANDAVTDGKLRNGVALSVIGRSANSTGDVADIAAANDGEVLRRSGTALGFGTIATAGIADDAVSNAKAANMAQSTIKGRAEGAGTGDPTDLSPTQVVSIIDGETVTWTGSHTFNGTNTAINGTNLTVSTSNNVSIGATNTLTLSGALVQATSPLRAASTFTLDAVLPSAATGANNLAIGSVNVVRSTGPIDPLTGMIAAADGQVVLLVNDHATLNFSVHIESASSSAANRFAGVGTSRFIKPGEMALAWYDGTSDRWRLLCRDDSDL